MARVDEQSQSKSLVAPDSIDYYQLLDLKPEWDADKLRNALSKALSECQSRVNAATGDKKKHLEQRIKWICDARKIIIDPDSKERYD